MSEQQFTFKLNFFFEFSEKRGLARWNKLALRKNLKNLHAESQLSIILAFSVQVMGKKSVFRRRYS